MERTVQTFKSQEFGEIRAVMVDMTPWFILKDVCNAVGFSNPTMAAKNVPDGSIEKISVCGVRGNPNFINIAGLNDMLKRSQKPKAKALKAWIQNDVLPSLKPEPQEPHGAPTDDLQILTIEGVDCYEKDGVVYLKLDAVARGLGFTYVRDGVEYIRWNTVNEYLSNILISQKAAKGVYSESEDADLGVSQEVAKGLNREFVESNSTIPFSPKVANGVYSESDSNSNLGFSQQVGKGVYSESDDADLGFSQQVGKGLNNKDFTPISYGPGSYIPENVFYRLAMKANNAAAEAFQAKIADEVIPSIRKRGAYMTKETIEKVLYDPDFILGLATQLKNEMEKTKNLETENKALAEALMTWDCRSVLNALVRSYSVFAFGGNFSLGWNVMYKQLRYKHGIDLKIRSGKDKHRKPMVNYLTDGEMRKAVSVAAAMCREKGMDVARAINSVNVKKVG